MPFSISKYKLCFPEHGLLINMTVNGIKIFSSKPNLDVKPALNIDQITELLKSGADGKDNINSSKLICWMTW